jgi:hypothetical protein
VTDQLDPFDPRFRPPGNGNGAAGQHERRPRVLVESMGPGPSHLSPQARMLRVGLPLAAALLAAGIGLAFFAGLRSGPRVERLGPEGQVRATVADRPLRVCLAGAGPCAWVSVVDGRWLALSTAGSLPEERGRHGVGWCPTSGHYGANRTGSRWDQAGRVVRGPAPRGLDRYSVRVDGGEVVVDFTVLQAGLQSHRTADTRPADGPDCEPVPTEPAVLPR